MRRLGGSLLALALLLLLAGARRAAPRPGDYVGIVIGGHGSGACTGTPASPATRC